jgi:two-component system chemotaxis response regulator CheY
MELFPTESKILIVDDSETARISIVDSLKELGYQNIVEAEDGVDGLDKLKEHDPVDLIFCDQNMPRMSGMDFLKKCKGEETYKKIPFTFISSEASKAFALEALSNGAVAVISKEMDSHQFGEFLKKIYAKILKQKK